MSLHTIIGLGKSLFVALAYAAKSEILLMEPVGGCDKLTAQAGLGTFFNYFNLLWPWLIGTASGIAVMMTLVGGLQVIISGGDQGKRQEGLDRIKNSMIGLLMLVFAGLILTTLNPSFFVTGSAGGGGC